MKTDYRNNDTGLYQVLLISLIRAILVQEKQPLRKLKSWVTSVIPFNIARQIV